MNSQGITYEKGLGAIPFLFYGSLFFAMEDSIEKSFFKLPEEMKLPEDESVEQQEQIIHR